MVKKTKLKKRKKERKENRNDRTTTVINTEIIRYSSPIKSLKIFNNEATHDYVLYIFPLQFFFFFLVIKVMPFIKDEKI